MCVWDLPFLIPPLFVKVYIFVQRNTWTFDLKRHNTFQNKNNRKATHSFAPRSLIFKLQQEVLRTLLFLNSNF